MCIGDSVVGEAPTLCSETSLTPPLVFTGRGVKSAKFGVIFNVAQLWGIGVWKCSKISQLWNKFLTWPSSPCVLTKVGEVRFTHPREQFGESAPLPRTGRRKCAKWSIILPRIVRFRSNSVQSFNTWRRKYHKSSRSLGLKVKVTARRNASNNLPNSE